MKSLPFVVSIFVLCIVTNTHAALMLDYSISSQNEFDTYTIALQSDDDVNGYVSSLGVCIKSTYDGYLNQQKPLNTTSLWKLPDDFYQAAGMDPTIDTHLLFDPKNLLIPPSSMIDSEHELAAAFTGFDSFTRRDIAQVVVPKGMGFSISIEAVTNKNQQPTLHDLYLELAAGVGVPGMDIPDINDPAPQIPQVPDIPIDLPAIDPPAIDIAPDQPDDYLPIVEVPIDIEPAPQLPPEIPIIEQPQPQPQPQPPVVYPVIEDPQPPVIDPVLITDDPDWLLPDPQLTDPQLPLPDDPQSPESEQSELIITPEFEDPQPIDDELITIITDEDLPSHTIFPDLSPVRDCITFGPGCFSTYPIEDVISVGYIRIEEDVLVLDTLLEVSKLDVVQSDRFSNGFVFYDQQSSDSFVQATTATGGLALVQQHSYLNSMVVNPEPASAILFTLAISAILTRRRVR